MRQIEFECQLTMGVSRPACWGSARDAMPVAPARVSCTSAVLRSAQQVHVQGYGAYSAPTRKPCSLTPSAQRSPTLPDFHRKSRCF